jgi:hypothetical protein
MIICLTFKRDGAIITYCMTMNGVNKMMNTQKVSKTQENLIQCAMMAVEFYRQATSSQMSLFPEPEPKREEQEKSDMAKKQAVRLPTATLEDIRQTAKDALDLKAKEIIYKTVGAETYTAWFHNRGFVCFFAQGMASFDVQGTFVKQQISQRFWPHCAEVLKKEMTI